MSYKFEFDYHPTEIVDALCEILHIENEAVKKDLEEAMYQLMAIVENPYNHDFYKTMYMVLESLTYRVETGDVRATEWSF